MDRDTFMALGAAGTLALTGLELLHPDFRRVTFQDPRRLRRNLAFLGASLLVMAFVGRLSQILRPVVPHVAWEAPLWLELPLVFSVGELLNWLVHWVKHKNDVLWRLHCQHHKDDAYTVWLTAHTHALEVAVSGTLIAAVQIGVGFSDTALHSYLLFYNLANTYKHSAHSYSLGWLDRIIVSPAYHRHHHARGDLNLGSTLTLWDVVFGTARWPSSWRERVSAPPIDSTPEPFGFTAEMLYVVSGAAPTGPADREAAVTACP